MTKWCSIILGVVVMWGVVAHAEDAQEIAGFSVPEYDKNGNLTSQLFGDFAQILPGGKVKIRNLKIEFYDEDEIEMRVTAPQCTYNQKHKEAQSDSSVRIARGNMIVTGVGFEWDSKHERLEIHKQAKVVLKSVRQHVDLGEKK